MLVGQHCWLEPARREVFAVVMTADRGLCGGFNSSIVRATRKRIAELQENGKSVKLLCVGKKGQISCGEMLAT